MKVLVVGGGAAGLMAAGAALRQGHEVTVLEHMEKPAQKILVTGCLAQRYQEEILKELPEVDGVLGTGSYYDVAIAVGQVLSGKRYKRFDDINADQSEDGRILTTPEYYAYLKIAEGCDNHCAYCVIPKLRGKLRSRPMEDLIKEAEQLAAKKALEIMGC